MRKNQGSESVSNVDGPWVRLWLASLCGVVAIILVVGGLTRLTQSGLSMVDWQPIMGVVPPLSQGDWLEKFEAYKTFPEYQQINAGMSLQEFKKIFLWEYVHRILARSVGILFLIPWLFFIWRKMISPKIKGYSLLGFGLGGLQGLMGWYMVKSGLVDIPHVSHLRLSAHLGLAVLIFGLYFWLFLSLRQNQPEKGAYLPSGLATLALGLCALVFIQIIYGGFVAGLKAGYMFNTFPKMYDQWIPAGVLSLQPLWSNLVNNGALVQFIHRCLAWSLLFLSGFMFLSYFKFKLPHPVGLAAGLLFGLTLAQFLLGVSTLLLKVPLSLASAHQFLALCVFASSLYLLRCLLPLKPETATMPELPEV